MHSSPINSNRLTIKGLLLLLLIPLFSHSQIEGKVVAIADGDTFTLLKDNEQIKIRLHGIDCPESGQDFGTLAKQFLSNLIFGKEVIVNKTDVDRYGRTIAIVFIDDKNVNEELLKSGMAWHYKYYDKNPTWAKMEYEAKINKKGLWIQPNPIEPWEFRKTRNNK